MSQFRLFYDNNGTATIVLTDASLDEVKLIAGKILNVSIETATKLKGHGFKDEVPVIPAAEEESTNNAELFTANENNQEKTVTPAVKSAEIHVNPITEDDNSVSENGNNIDVSILDAPVVAAPTPMVADNNLNHNEDATNDAKEENYDEDYVFTFGSYKNTGTADLIAENPTKAFSYFQWLLRKGILKTKTPNEDVFKTVVYRNIRNYYSQFPLKEEEAKDFVYVCLSCIDADEASSILSLLGFGSIDELYSSNNVQCYEDAIKMALAE